MSAVLTPPPAGAPPAPAGRLGGLLRAEAHRLLARRAVHLLVLLAGAAWVAATLIGLTQFGTPTPERLAEAEAQRQESVEASIEARESCLASAPAGESPDDWCGPPVSEADLELHWFLDPAPFSLADDGTDGAIGFAAAASVLAFLVAATSVGAEWSTRSIVALLFWETRRPRVIGAKTTVVAAASLAIGVAAQLAWLATAGLWQAVAGDDAPLPADFWSGLLGFGLTNLVRNTGATLGVGFVYFAVVESAVRALRPTWQPWLLTDNAVALVVPDGLTLYTGNSGSPGPGLEPTEYLLGNLQAGVFLAVVTAVVLTIGTVLFSRRDLH